MQLALKPSRDLGGIVLLIRLGVGPPCLEDLVIAPAPLAKEKPLENKGNGKKCRTWPPSLTGVPGGTKHCLTPP